MQPNVQTYTAVIIVLAHAGQAERAMQMFRRMEMADVRADLLAYNAIMTAHAHGGHWCAYPLPYPFSRWKNGVVSIECKASLARICQVCSLAVT